MAKKLPKPLTREELDLLIYKVKAEREEQRGKRNKQLNTRGKRINHYLICIILGSHSGMRISEIIGLRPEGSKCCRRPIREESGVNQKGDKLKLKVCSKCGKKYSSGEILRLNNGWDIEPLTKDKFQKDRIFVSQGKGEKDRWVWRPKLIKDFLLNEFPLKVSRRSIQKYITQKGKEFLNRHMTFHDLRHTFATEFLKKNPQDIRTLQVLLGHSRLDTTAIYSQVSVDDAMKKVGDVF